MLWLLGCAVLERLKRSRELVEEMVVRGTKLCTVTVNTMLDACCKRWKFVELDRILGLMEKEGLRFNINAYRVLIYGFTSSGKFKEAESLVNEMHDKGLKVDTHFYNLIINGYCRAGCTEGACLVDEMTQRNVNRNADTYLCVISGFATMERWRRQWHTGMRCKARDLKWMVLCSIP